ncbi:mechanosensitive ion channel domain-containing protein [uncultured Deefgea sp.]|uniref:mechanosensitive ion channel domain-containing protein n=1 Tax=uncultured Deefgea sp. TaxID=1304914 RepID=UPI0025947D29|nr:mechanosensitive ion channel domain-containing protein [uncultured Deefgea sp.]
MTRFLAVFLLLLLSNVVAAPIDLLLARPENNASSSAALISSDSEFVRLNQRLELAQSALTALEKNTNSPDRELSRFWLTLEIYAYRQHIAALNGLNALDQQDNRITPIHASQSDVQRQNERQLLEQEIDVLRNNLSVQETYLNTIHDELGQAQAELRLHQGLLEKTTTQSTRTQIAAQVAISQHKVDTWLATLASIDARQQFNRAQLQARREQVLALDTALGPNQNQLQGEVLNDELQHITQQQQHYAQLQNIQINKEQQLRQQLNAIKAQRTTLNRQLDSTKTSNKTQLQTQQSTLDQQEQALQQQLETLAIESGVLSDLMMTNTIENRFWKKRVSLKNSGKQAEIQRLNEEAQNWLNTLRNMRAAMQKSAGIAQDQLDQLSKASDTPAVLRQTWQEREAIYRESAIDLRRSDEKFNRWLNETAQQDKTLSMRTDYWQEKMHTQLSQVWHYELFSVNDHIEVDGQRINISRGVTIGKMCIAVLLITVGFALCIFISHFIEKALIQRSRFPEVSVRIAKRWILSIAFIGLLINSLLIVQIPLAAFAFLGGAIAIGLGFGMQTLLKNLISGLMMLLERPFRPGDTIAVAGILGTVVDMNVRAAVVRDVNGIDTLVPNSTFLEQNVTNWSYTNSIIRQGFQVGVAYGSDLRLVAKLLEEEVLRHGQICKNKAPEILFEDFAADALTFGIYYWLDIGAGTIGRQVASDLRFMIDASFRKHDICIAYPQRDVHLDVSSPLKIQFQTSNPALASGKTAAN